MRFNAVTFPHAGAWLRAISNPNLSLAMSSLVVVTALHWRLGVLVFSPPQVYFAVSLVIF